jgi:AcrR family transcriptional regulator
LIGLLCPFFFANPFIPTGMLSTHKKLDDRQPDSEIALLRREQIVQAAVAVIAEQGIQNLSLSEIEKKADMSRGQLTYYFRTKEAILLAVFDHVLETMYRRLPRPAGATPEEGPFARAGGWELVQTLLRTILLEPPISEFGCLQYTFLAQISHREDFRERLASLYEEWRSHMAQRLEEDQAAGQIQRSISGRALASVIQALLHGLAMQALADPAAFDRQAVLELCLDMLSSYLGVARPLTPQRYAPVSLGETVAFAVTPGTGTGGTA